MKCSDFPKHLREARRRSGMSQADLAELLGLSLRQFQKIEERDHIPKAGPFVKGCAFIGIPPDEYFTDEDEEEPESSFPASAPRD